MSSESEPAPFVEYKVSRVLWENFESVLLAQTRRYIGELAHRLQVPEKELQRKVLPSSDTLMIMMMDTSSDTTQCRAYVQHDNITSFCRKPVAYQSEFCSFHRIKRMNIFMDAQPVTVTRIRPENTKEPMWIRDTTVINSKGETMGRINKNTQTIKWFQIEE